MDDNATIGARLRVLRRYRGMTQAQLGGLAGIAPTLISMIETGQRPLDRRSQIASLAAALRVSEADLTGAAPHLGTDPQQSGPHALIPPLRAALLTNSLTRPATDQARPAAELAAALRAEIIPLQADASYTTLGPLLPSMIDELYWHAAQPAGEAARRLALESLVDACIVAGLTARDLGHPDLAHVAVLKAGEAAVLLDDPVQQGKAACLSIWTLPRERSWDRRLAAAEAAAAALEPHARSPLGLQVLGILTLHAALSATVAQRTQAADHWLAEARQLAARVPDDIQANWQAFSATNVQLWDIAISVERGQSGTAILNLAGTVDPARITRKTRRANFLADVGRGLAREAKTRGEAVRWLHRAEHAAPQLIRNSPATRDTVAYLLNQSRMRAGGTDLRGMASRMGVLH